MDAEVGQISCKLHKLHAACSSNWSNSPASPTRLAAERPTSDHISYVCYSSCHQLDSFDITSPNVSGENRKNGESTAADNLVTTFLLVICSQSSSPRTFAETGTRKRKEDCLGQHLPPYAPSQWIPRHQHHLPASSILVLPIQRDQAYHLWLRRIGSDRRHSLVDAPEHGCAGQRFAAERSHSVSSLPSIAHANCQAVRDLHVLTDRFASNRRLTLQVHVRHHLCDLVRPTRIIDLGQVLVSLSRRKSAYFPPGLHVAFSSLF